MTRRFGSLAVAATFSALLAACASGGETRIAGAPTRAPVVNDPAPYVSGTMRSYEIRGRRYQPREQPGYDERGLASWYGPGFDGRRTASGEVFDQHGLTAAHKTLPLPSLAEITNPANGQRIVVRVNDRGPFADNRILDLSRGAAEALGMVSAGVGEVRVRWLGPAPRLGGGMTLASARPDASDRADGLRGPVPYSQVVAADPTPAPQPEPVLRGWVSPGEGTLVQAGTFADIGNARRAVDRLGSAARMERTGQGFYRVVVGPWSDPAAAERSRRAVISRGFPDALLISAS